MDYRFDVSGIIERIIANSNWNEQPGESEDTEDTEVGLIVVDRMGLTVETTITGIYQPADNYSIHWNGYNYKSQPAVSGICLVAITAGTVRKIQKIMLLR